MALSVVRKGVASLTGRAGRSLITPVTIVRPQVATIVSKAFRDSDYKRPPPYPYKEYDYGFFRALLDKTTQRFDENSKILVIDGPVAVGKTEVAKVIAEELDMLYVPHATMDMVYINDYGYDMRQLDPEMPDSCKSFDEKNFLSNPTHRNAARFQFEMFAIRLEQYIDAIAHVLSTGQGVVMDRSVYSDFVFAETMTECGYMSKKAHNMYLESRKLTVPELMRPHLVIYLDIPAELSLQRIKERNLPHEINSPVYTSEFLSQMEHFYKQRFLKEISTHSQVLVYDWSDKGDAEVVVEDIERVNFEFDKNDPKMSDWKFSKEWDWCEQRMKYTYTKDQILKWMIIPDYSVEELAISAEDYGTFEEQWWNAPGMKYDKGFNTDMGDQFILFKTRRGA